MSIMNNLGQTHSPQSAIHPQMYLAPPLLRYGGGGGGASFSFSPAGTRTQSYATGDRIRKILNSWSRKT